MALSRAAVADLDRRVLDDMQLGLFYETRDLAITTGLGMSHVQHILERLARSGAVTRIEPVWRGLPVSWRRS